MRTEGATEATPDAGVPDDKRIVCRFKLPRDRNAYMALAAADGTYWVAGGYAHALYQYAADGHLLRSFEAPQPPGLVNHFYAGFQMLPDGHIVQANWTGHSAKDFKEGWKLIEFDAQGQVVWHWHVPCEQAGTINNVIVLDHLDPAVFNDDAGGILGPRKSRPRMRTILSTVAALALCCVGRAAGAADPARRVDFRYAPPAWQATICMPDDSDKALAGKQGEFLDEYGAGSKAEPFGLMIGHDVAGGSTWVGQHLLSATAPSCRRGSRPGRSRSRRSCLP